MVLYHAGSSSCNWTGAKRLDGCEGFYITRFANDHTKKIFSGSSVAPCVINNGCRLTAAVVTQKHDANLTLEVKIVDVVFVEDGRLA